MPKIMAILNATPDSFSDGGQYYASTTALAAAHTMLEQGADIIDIGGESTRPHATPVPPEEEQRRIIPLITTLARTGATISADTRNASTMQAALDAGAAIINDVSALQHDPAAPALLARYQCQVVLMHMRGTPQTMATHTTYDSVTQDVLTELTARIEAAIQAGIARARLIIDPGFGFAKTAAQNVTLLQNLSLFKALNLPILVGLSRKSFIGHLTNTPEPTQRLPGSLAAALYATTQGATHLRVHDIAATRQALAVWQSVQQG